MQTCTDRPAPASLESIAVDDSALSARVMGEFWEMPGLTLTLPQASRMFSLEPTACQRVLGALVRSGHLITNGRAYARADASCV